MKTLIASLIAAAAFPVAMAQSAAVSAERSRLAEERRAVETAFTAREKGCYRRFAVNDCLSEARAERRDALAVVRKQEVVLNDAERRRKATERLQELDERAAARTGAEREGSPPAGSGGAAPAPVSGRGQAGTAAPGVPLAPGASPVAPGRAAAPGGTRPDAVRGQPTPARRPTPPATATAPAKARAAAPTPPRANGQRQQRLLEEAQARKKRVAEKAAGRIERAKPLPVP